MILGLGGTTRQGSSTERALRIALAAAEHAGAETVLIGAGELELPMYASGRIERDDAAAHLIESIRRADGLIVATPGYHGGISGHVKNALDYIEDLRDADPPYLDGRAVGCIVCAHGWQATTTTLIALRSVVHALRGWPTPLGVTINSAIAADQESEARPTANLQIMARQVVDFAALRARA